MRRRWIAVPALASTVALAVCISTSALAQPRRAAAPGASQDGDTSRLPQFENGLEHQPKNPTDKVAFSLEDADLNELVRTIGELTGKRFILSTKSAKGFKGTIFAPQKITVAEAYQAFLSLLTANNMTVVPYGRYLKIVDTRDAARTPFPIEGMTSEDRFITRVHRLAHIGGEEVATAVLSKFQSTDGSVVPYGNLLIMTDTGTNIRRMVRLLEDIDVEGARDRMYFEPIHHVPAAEVEKRLSEIFDLKGKSAAAPPGAAGAAASASGARGELHISKIVAIDRPNSIVVIATDASYRRLLPVIQQIDVVAPDNGQMHVVALQYADAKKIIGPLNEAVAGAAGTGAVRPGGTGPAPLSVLESPVKISAEETTNSLIITSSPRDYASVLEVVAKLDRPRRQVYIEAVIMDLSIARTTQLGVSWHGADTGADGSLMYGGFNPKQSVSAPGGDTPLQALALGVRGVTVPGSEAIGMSIPALGAFLNAVAVTSDADILSTPHILATDNIAAEIKVQLNTALQQNAQSFSGIPGLGGAQGAASGALAGLGGLGGYGAVSTPYGKIGPRIKVTPHLNESDEVRLDVEETISDLTGEKPQGTLGTVSFIERSATTTLTVKDQTSIVIAGLVRSKISHGETKVPLLGDIPILGMLFRSSSDTVEKSNLVLVLTPYIIREQDDLRRIYERKMQERQEFLDHYFVFSDNSYEAPKDYTRTKGLLGEIRAAYRDVDDKRAAEALSRPPEQRTHEPRAPLDSPAPGGGRNAELAPSAPGAAPSTPPNIRLVAPVRNIERIER